ncbi:unnamed protein product [Lampetra planeri]
MSRLHPIALHHSTFVNSLGPFVHLQLVLLLVVLLGSCDAAWDSPGKHRGGACAEPSDNKLRMQLRKLEPTIAPGFGGSGENSLLVDGTEDVQRHSCPSGATGGKGKDIKDRSVSPWSFTVNQDSSRYPRRIKEAYCLCDGCLLGHDGQEERSVMSKPFFTSIMVLRRTKRCHHGRYVYKPDLETIALFCTCSA